VNAPALLSRERALRAAGRGGASALHALVAPAIGFLPLAAPYRTAEDRQELKRLVEAAALAGANDWPGRALTLFQMLCGISMGLQTSIPVGSIGGALDDFFAARAAPLHAWQTRADIGEVA